MKYYIVDVFAENKYEGNQLAVFIPEEKMEQTEMQNIAREMNFSETTFIMSGLQEDGGYDVKIFSRILNYHLQDIRPLEQPM